jgi:hypothetical protein
MIAIRENVKVYSFFVMGKKYRFVAIVDMISDINKFGRSQKFSDSFLKFKKK